MSIEDLYQPLIIEHCRRPRGRRSLGDDAIQVVRADHPCGDEARVEVSVSDGRVSVSAVGQGCALNCASASIMASVVEQMPVDAVREIDARLRGCLENGPSQEGGHLISMDAAGDVAALAAAKSYPGRVPCVLLSWDALRDALDRWPKARSSQPRKEAMGKQGALV
jgi:nitrogen fixation NifU-like protein